MRVSASSRLLMSSQLAFPSVTCERVAEWLRRLTRKPKVRTAVGSNPRLDCLVAVRNSSPVIEKLNVLLRKFLRTN